MSVDCILNVYDRNGIFHVVDNIQDEISFVSALQGLLESPALQERALLPVSTLVHSYCRRLADCETDTAVTDLIAILEKNVGNGCYVNKANIDKVRPGTFQAWQIELRGEYCSSVLTSHVFLFLLIECI